MTATKTMKPILLKQADREELRVRVGSCCGMLIAVRKSGRCYSAEINAEGFQKLVRISADKFSTLANTEESA